MVRVEYSYPENFAFCVFRFPSSFVPWCRVLGCGDALRERRVDDAPRERRVIDAPRERRVIDAPRERRVT